MSEDKQPLFQIPQDLGRSAAKPLVLGTSGKFRCHLNCPPVPREAQ